MSQKEETVQKLSRLRENLTSEKNGGALLETVDIDREVYKHASGKMVGRQLGEIVGRRAGERLGHAFDERFDRSSITDVVSGVFETDEETETGETEETAEDGSEESGTDVGEMSTEELQSLANQLMEELEQRNETEDDR
ncbi:hypothetical protein [Halocatena salina]|uniref:Uncharacterized protein n=1 Tax=Halocatena salina TaxID=2934340 RepID=A0A8U0ABB1_9EURY|nr:hypothetical protein [Halocatena salina]UPM45057.1 hypothetical protein MW046_18560 [Halocatena salina]